ncbi:MAG: hypothetical protein WD336_00580 [Trueperaceae bacterium]
MNRTVRRAEKKKEIKQEKDREKAKAAVRKRREERRAMARKRRETRVAARTSGGDAKQAGEGEAKAPKNGEKAANGGDAPARRGSNPGRFAGALLFATVFFISLQAVAPSDASLVGQAVSASFYLLFGYFAVLWMNRRGTQSDPVPLAVIAATLMGVVTFVSQWFQPALEPLPVMLALIVPLSLAGATLGRLVWNRAP